MAADSSAPLALRRAAKLPLVRSTAPLVELISRCLFAPLFVGRPQAGRLYGRLRRGIGAVSRPYVPAVALLHAEKKPQVFPGTVGALLGSDGPSARPARRQTIVSRY